VLGRLSRNGHHLHRETVHHDQQQQQQSQSQQQSQPQTQAAVHSTAAQTTGATASTVTTAQHHVDINDLDLDDLSARLYSRLRSRLRLELLVDRERAGQLTDYR
jgi:hypothetical protein